MLGGGSLADAEQNVFVKTAVCSFHHDRNEIHQFLEDTIIKLIHEISGKLDKFLELDVF